VDLLYIVFRNIARLPEPERDLGLYLQLLNSLQPHDGSIEAIWSNIQKATEFNIALETRIANQSGHQ